MAWRARRKRREGAAMLESALVMFVLCLILFGLIQVSYLVAAKDVISFSAITACRSATVGMHDEFVNRVVRTTSIPMAGPSISVSFTDERMNQNGPIGSVWDRALSASPVSDQFWAEYYAIPYYLGTSDESELSSWLNYYNWVHSDTLITADPSRSDDTVGVYVQQYVPLVFPFARLFYRGNMGQMTRANGVSEVPRSRMDAFLEIENHAALYLTDQ